MSNTTYCFNLREDSPTANDLVGSISLTYNQLSKNNVPIVNGFAISGFAFDEFILQNDLVDLIVAKLGEIAEKPGKTKKASAEIKKKITSGKIPEHILLAINEQYEKLAHKSHAAVVRVTQSPLNKDLDERRALGRQYDYGEVFGIDELAEVIKKAWANLFSEEMLQFRQSVDYEGNLSQPLIVHRLQNAEISGILYNFDINSATENEVTLIANLGVTKERPIAKSFNIGSKDKQPHNNNLSDYYLLHKVNGNILKTIDNSQKFMWIRPHQGEKTDLVQVKISKAWSERVKLDDLLREKLLSILSLIEKKVNGKFEVDFVYESGKFTITSINEIAAENVSLLPDVNWEETKSAISESQSQAESDTDKQPKDNGEKESADEKKLDVVDKKEALDFFAEHQGELVLSEVERSAKADSVKEMLPEVKTITEVWWDKRKPASEIKVFANNIEGYGIFTFTEIAEALDIKEIERMKELKKVQKQVCEYLAIYAVAASPKPIFIQLDRDINFEAQIEIFSQLRNLYGHKNFWAIMPQIRGVEEIAHYKKVLSANSFRRTNLFKVFQLVSQPLFLANLPAVIDQSIDGIVLDIDKIYANLLGIKLSQHPQGNNLDLLMNFLVDNLIEKSQTKLFTYIKTDSEILLQTILDELLENGINGIIYKGDDLYDFKQTLTEKESHILTKNLKQIKDKLHKNGKKSKKK
jgi:hypothetical protein